MREEFFKKILDSLFKTVEKLKEREDYINNLNVFPVPDGDTGTNMLMTLNESMDSSYDENVNNFLKNISKTIVLKAHGNSGIIFSTFIKSFLDKILNFSNDELNSLKKAFEIGLLESYKILDDPIEGTILTVIKESEKGIREGENLKDSIKKAYIYGLEALEKTKELLPSLKEAGVVDAGGEGFLAFLESLYEIFIDEKIIRELKTISNFNLSIWRKRPKYRNCVDVVVEKERDCFGIINQLKNIGDSIIFLEDNEKVKIHIHTNKLDELIKTINNIGEIKEINIRNMRKQQLEFLLDVEIAIITFSLSENIKDLFYSLGASIVIDENENLSFEDLIEIVDDIPSQYIIFLPNDKNLYMTLKKIKEISNKKIEIVKTSSIPEAIEAILNFDRTNSLEENFLNMKESIKRIKSGIIGVSTKNLNLKDLKIKEGDFFATINDRIIAKGGNLTNTLFNLLNKIKFNEGSLLLIYGDGVNFDEIEMIRFEMKRIFPKLNIEVYNGGQKNYKIIYSFKSQN
ncbi:MAG: DAK2 domain-containing protein [Caldisericia bacterium]